MTIKRIIDQELCSPPKHECWHLPIPIGFCSDRKVKELDVLDTCPHCVFITGVCGIGKSTLLQNIVANGAFRYSPDELTFYLVDSDNDTTFDCFRELPHVKEVRHQGLLVGVEFDDTISGVDVKHEALHRHLLITSIGAHTIRMIPPLIVTEEDCSKAVSILEDCVSALL